MTKLLVFGSRVKISIIVIVCGGSFVGIKDFAVLIRLLKLLKMKYFFNIKMFKAYQWVKSNNFNRFQIKDTVLSELIKCWEKAEVKTWAKSDINPPFVRRRGSESLNNPGSVIPDCRCQRHKDLCLLCLCPALGPIITDHSRPQYKSHFMTHFRDLGLRGLLGQRRRLRLEKKASMFHFSFMYLLHLI